MGVYNVRPGPLGVEGERTTDVCVVRVLDAFKGPLPAARQLGRLNQTVWSLNQGWLACKGQGCVDDSPDVRTGHVQGVRAGCELLPEAGDLVAQVTLGPKWRGG